MIFALINTDLLVIDKTGYFWEGTISWAEAEEERELKIFHKLI
jgi:hypothetical protein